MLKRVPQLPGVYAWFRCLELGWDKASPELCEDIRHLLEAPAGVAWRAHVGPFDVITLQKLTRVTDWKSARLVALLDRPWFRSYARELLRATEELQAPLYVGSGLRLRQRISQHLHIDSPLRTRFVRAGVSLNDCVLVYKTFDLPDGPGDEESTVALVLEDLVTRICRPGFVMRVG